MARLVALQFRSLPRSRKTLTGILILQPLCQVLLIGIDRLRVISLPVVSFRKLQEQRRIRIAVAQRVLICRRSACVLPQTGVTFTHLRRHFAA